MRRILYDSRAIPLDVLLAQAVYARGRFGDPEPTLCETKDSPKTDPEELETDNA